MTRTQSVLNTLLLIRHEKNPPLIRYTLLLALANTHPVPQTSMQLCDATRDDIPQNGTLDTMVESGLITRHSSGNRARTYTLTPAGEAEAARIITGKEKPKPAPNLQPDLAKVAAALR
jgi:hypothetical protein